MRIGMMSDVYKPHVSGITNYISLNKRYLELAGHEVFIFTLGDLDFADDDTNVIRSPGLPLVDTGYTLNFRYSRRAKALVQSMDVVHVNHPFISGSLALRYCRPLQIPVVFTNHTRYDLYAQVYLPVLPEEVSETLLQSYMPRFCASVDLVVSPSEGMAGVLRDLGVEIPIEIIPNGVELNNYYKGCEDCREEFGFTRKDLLLIYAGRLGPEKGLDFLLQAFIGVAEAVPNVHLLLVGGGPEEERLKETASQSAVSNRIHFMGMVQYSRMPSFLAMCDVFVTASVTEVHPLSVVEAMASGLPVVGVQSVGVGDTVVDGLTGWLARRDPAAFAAKMTSLCLDSSLRRKMGAAARREAEKYDIERTSKLLEAQYQRLVSAASPRKRDLRTRFRQVFERMHG